MQETLEAHNNFFLKRPSASLDYMIHEGKIVPVSIMLIPVIQRNASCLSK